MLSETLWFCVNGWFGRNILWASIDIGTVKVPRLTLTVVAAPAIVPTPIDSFGLKYTTSFALDVK